MRGCVKSLICLLVLTFHLSHGFNLTVLHTNDFHARIEEMNRFNGRCSSADASEDKCYGGTERLKTKVDELRAQYPQSLLLDGGDQYQGTLLFHVFGGEIMAHFMNIVGYDAIGLGNHEFDTGPEGLEPFVRNATFKILSSNINVSETPELSTIQKSTIFDIDGEKIGVIGYTTSETPIISKPGKVTFTDEISAIQREVDNLVAQGINKIIALGHSGFAKDVEIAHKVTGLDIVVGGHTNTFLYTGSAPGHEKPVGSYPTVIKNVDGKTVLVVQDFAYGKYLGFLQVEFSNNGEVNSWNGNPILLDKTVQKDSHVTQVIQSYLPEIEKIKKQRIGVSLVHLDGDRQNCRARECNMGNMIADSMVRQNHRYADSLEWNHVAIAIMNSGGIRTSITKGEITTADCLGVMPFRNTVDIIELSGRVILDVLEHSADGWVTSNQDNGAFLQISGLRVVYDMKQTKGKRVVQVHVLCTNCSIPEFEPLNMDQKYKLLTNSFLVTGADGFVMIKDNIQGYHTIGDLDSEILLDYLEENSPIVSGIDGRITFVDSTEQSGKCTNIGSIVLPCFIMHFLIVAVVLYMV